MYQADTAQGPVRQIKLYKTVKNTDKLTVKNVVGFTKNLIIFRFLAVFIFLNTTIAFAGPNLTTYQAKIIKPDGYPLEFSNVNFRFSVLDPGGSCSLYIEDYTAVNMAGSGGLISFALGSGVRSYPTSGTAQTFRNIFDNSVASLSCQSASTYNPSSSDTRKIVMQFNDGSGWQTLPAMSINAVPYAMYATKANEAKTLNDKLDTAFVEKINVPTCTSDRMLYFNGVSFSCVTYSAGSGGVTSVTTSGSVLITGGTASSPVISITAATMSQDGYLTQLDYAEFKSKLSASSSQIVNTLGFAPVSGAAVAAQIDATATVSATANTIVKRDASGNASFSGLSANITSLNYVDIYKPSTSFNIRLQAPTSLSANYTLNLPTTSGTTGQVLTTDGAGNLSWINSATGSVTSVSGTANEITSTGGSTPLLGLANAGTAGTYFKVITDNKGRVTSGVTTLLLSDLPASVLSTTSNYSGDISGMISNITVNRIQGVSVTITTLSTNDILQYDGAKYINKNIPTCSGSQYLTFTGTNFSCVADSGASGTITTISVTGPISSTGGSNPTLSIVQASSSLSGFLSAADFNTFNGKQNATSAAIIATLGYAPADNAASGTYLQKAGNLSDLMSMSSARTNLGLGSLAVGNSVDLGSASATGTLATARIPAFSGDATITAASNTIILSNSGVSAGTYTKITVDAKGRVTSSSALVSSDVTTALGYTPANSTSATQWTTSGSTIFYNTGNVGIGISSPAQRLSVAGLVESTSGGIKFPDGSIQATANISGIIDNLVSGTTTPYSTSSACPTYVDIENSSKSVVFPNSGVIGINWSMSYYAGGAGTGVTARVCVGATCGGDTKYFTNEALSHKSMSSSWFLSVPAGTYPVKLQFCLRNGPGPLQQDVNDYVSWTVYSAGFGGGGSSDNLGSHVATQNIVLGSNWLSGNGTNDGLRIDTSGNVGIGIATPVTKFDVSGGVRISMEPATCAASYAGTLRYNSGNVEYCNGTSWSAFGVAGSGIAAINGSTSATQTFANNLTGTAPSFLTANGVHTLNIPFASVGTTTAGLISFSDYANFSNKITSSSTSIAQVLGYVPASATSLANYLLRSNNLSDLASSATARTNLGLGGFATVSSVDLGTASATGTLSAARLPAFAGDAITLTGSTTTTVVGLRGISVSATTPTSGQILTYDGSTWAALNPVPGAYGLDVKHGMFAAPGTTGNFSITGLGFRPTLVRFWVQYNRTGTMAGTSADVCTGSMSPSGQQSYYTYINTSANGVRNYVYSDRTIACSAADATSIQIEASYVSMNSDGFTLNFTLATPGWTVVYEALGGSTSASSGSGTAGYIPIWNSSTSLGSSPLFVSGTHVGLGTSSPTNSNGWERVLDVFAPSHSKIVSTQNISGVSVTTGIFSHGLTANGYGGYPVSHGGIGLVGTESNHDLGIMTNNTAKMSITKQGNVGIGTISPSAKLEVAGGLTKLEQEAWQNPTFLNGWINYESGVWDDAGFFKDSQGFVHVKGLIKNGTAGTVAFTLPVGYRPLRHKHFSAPTYNASDAGMCIVRVYSTGNVEPSSACNNGWVSLESIRFRVN